jgi:hypothetical protein
VPAIAASAADLTANLARRGLIFTAATILATARPGQAARRTAPLS